jgi:hypothetical protein
MDLGPHIHATYQDRAKWVHPAWLPGSVVAWYSTDFGLRHRPVFVRWPATWAALLGTLAVGWAVSREALPRAQLNK